LEKIQRENMATRKGEPRLLLPDLDDLARPRGAGWVFESLLQRFQRSSVRIREFFVDIVQRNLGH
jgi:hypothetical protein